MKIIRWVIIVALASGLAAAGALTYKRWSTLKKPIAKEASSVLQEAALASPPFATKEPEHYQATRVITNFGSEPEHPTTLTIRIARSGEKRREDYDSDAPFETRYLTTSTENLLLLPATKIYADVGSQSTAGGPLPATDDQEAGVSTERLLNEVSGLARYEKLGTEELNGQPTTKYRVTSEEITGGTATATVTLIWIDEHLGMPIRSETAVPGGNAKQITELREIQLQVDPAMFELPKGYRKVAYSELLAQLKQNRGGANADSREP